MSITERKETRFIDALVEFMKTSPSEAKLTKWLKKYSRENMLHFPITSLDLALLVINLNNSIIELENGKEII